MGRLKQAEQGVDALKAGEKTKDAVKNGAKTEENITRESKDIAKNSDGIKTNENQSGKINKKADEATDVAKQAADIDKSAVDNVAEAGNATRKFVKETSDESLDLDKVVEEAVDKASEGVEGVSNLKYKEGYYVEHTTGIVKKFTERNGISGGHNYEEFKKYFNDPSNKYQLEEIGRKNHSDIDGVFDIEYKVKYEKMDYTGKKGTGEYKIMPKGKPYKKTVYDSKIISNDEIIDLSKKAMEEGLKKSRIIQLTKQKKIKIQGQAKYKGKILKFEGMKNLETGEIENAYPVLEWE